jgi:hypothetical protein
VIEQHMRNVFPKYSPDITLPIRTGKNSRFHEALLWEFALGDMERYIVDFEKVFTEALKFLKYRGTIYSMNLALSWVGFQEAKFNRLSRVTYEVDPGKPFTSLHIKAIQSACRQSAPATATLKRIFHKQQSVSL